MLILNEVCKEYGSKIRPNETWGLIFDPYCLKHKTSFCLKLNVHKMTWILKITRLCQLYELYKNFWWALRYTLLWLIYNTERSELNNDIGENEGSIIIITQLLQLPWAFTSILFQHIEVSGSRSSSSSCVIAIYFRCFLLELSALNMMCFNFGVVYLNNLNLVRYRVFWSDYLKITIEIKKKEKYDLKMYTCRCPFNK